MPKKTKKEIKDETVARLGDTVLNIKKDIEIEKENHKKLIETREQQLEEVEVRLEAMVAYKP